MNRTKPVPLARLREIARYLRDPENFGAVGPWRCVECGVPVVPGRRTPCKCLPHLNDTRLTP